MINLLRFSDTGFEPQFQTRMAKQIDYILTFEPSSLDDLDATDYAKHLIIKTVADDKENLNSDFELYGIHVFFENVAGDNDIGFYLNHLKRRPQRCSLTVPGQRIGYRLCCPYL